MNQEKHADGKDENERADEQSKIEMQISRDAIKGTAHGRDNLHRGKIYQGGWVGGLGSELRRSSPAGREGGFVHPKVIPEAFETTRPHIGLSFHK